MDIFSVLKGAKHLKAASRQSQTTPDSVPSSVVVPPDRAVLDNLPGSIIFVADAAKKNAGTYKCKTCGVMLNSESQMKKVIKNSLLLLLFFQFVCCTVRKAE